MDDAETTMRFEGGVIHWRGPSPFFFVPLPEEVAARVRALARAVSYGWGVVPVAARLDEIDFTTSLFPKPPTYYLPLKDAVRRKANVTAGDRVQLELRIAASAERTSVSAP